MRFPISALLVVFALWAPCSAVAQLDLDEDGFFDTEDCNDGDPTIYPGADDVACDGVDTDCDGTVEIWYRDADGDGVGTNSDVLITCTQPPGYVAIRFDCDDTDPLRFPGAPDPCDGFDADCDGNGERWYTDLDGDGYGVLSTEVIACIQPPNTVILTGDCDDSDPNVSPGVTEICGDALDNDCNGTADDQTTWYQDTDGDGFGSESNTLSACEQPAGYSANPGDCDDANAGVYPLAGPGIGCASCSAADKQYIQDQYSQIWNETGITITNVTPGLTGQAAWNAVRIDLLPFLAPIAPSCRQCVVERAYCAYLSCQTACVPWQLIGTGGIYPGTPTCNQCVALGGCNVAFNACVGVIDQDGDGYLSTNDCNDLDPAINPGVEQETCDGIDNDCNGLVDEQFVPVFADSDGDGYGDPNAPVMCATPGSVPNNTDCDDSDGAIHPNAAELIDGIDNDCDGQVDEIQCNDTDGDGTTDCQGDCNDNEPSVFPGAAEICGDGLDNDCNGTVDDQTTWYEDADGDGFGTESNTLLACEQPAGYSANPGDCDDANTGVYPLAGPGIGCASCSAADKQYIQDQYSQIWNETGITITNVTPGLTGQAAWNAVRIDLLPFLAPIAPSCRQCVVERAYCAYLSCQTACVPWQLIGTGGIYPGTPTCNQCVALGGCNAAFNACVGVIDQDGDGYLSTNDCDDLNPTTNPGADELCDGVDNDCDGLVDEEFTPVFADSDGDGYGDPNAPVMCATPGSVGNNTDCNDTNNTIHPSAPELIDGLDNDCDGLVDEIQCNDVDSDGITDCDGDCDDNDPTLIGGVTLYVFSDLSSIGSLVHYTISQGSTVFDGDVVLTEDPQDPEYSSGIVSVCLAAGCFAIEVSPNDAPISEVASVEFSTDPGFYIGFEVSETFFGTNGTPAAEVCDGSDNDCDGEVDESSGLFADADGDGFGDQSVPVPCGQPGVANSDDCDDFDDQVHPGAFDVPCDGPDADCDGTSEYWYQDFDGDGYGDASFPLLCGTPGAVPDNTDCYDLDPNMNPGMVEDPFDGIDNDCDGEGGFFFTDDDNDGYTEEGGDCDDDDPAINPDALDLCSAPDGLDNDCNGSVDDGGFYNWLRDQDGDGFGDESDVVYACIGPPGYILGMPDCDDTNANVNQWQPEIPCDGLDNNCIDGVDEITPTWYQDLDGDGYGCCVTIATCTEPSGYSLNGGDCDDQDASIHPGAAEPCDGVDQDCDGQDPAVYWFPDADGDGYGFLQDYVLDCTQPTGYVNNFDDCDDSDPLVNPDAVEVCDGINNNCDFYIDEGVMDAWYADADGDGYGTPDAPIYSCLPVPDRVLYGGDCNDNDPALNPLTPEACNNVDDNCNGIVDEGLQQMWYLDFDGDGYGQGNITYYVCQQPAGYAAVSGDCDISNPAINPGATEVCNGFDDNCNGQVDEGFTWYTDADGDGAGDPTTATFSCTPIPGMINVGGDCDDTDPLLFTGGTLYVYKANANDEGSAHYVITNVGYSLEGDVFIPGGFYGYGEVPLCLAQGCMSITLTSNGIPLLNYALLGLGGQSISFPTASTYLGGVGPMSELCDGVDNDCDGLVDEIFTWYADLDGDSYGDDATSIYSCTPIPGRILFGGDCDDSNPAVSQGSSETCDGLDNNCNGQVDEGCVGCNPADIALLAVFPLEWAPEQSCLFDCADAGGDQETIIACLAACYAAEGLGLQCATCLIEYQFCAATQCAICEEDPNSAACIQCQIASGCHAQFASCTGLVDNDFDGYFAPFDCNDNNATVYPDAPEGCIVDGLDNDCDGLVDEDALVDADNDGFTLCSGDCNDTDDTINPDATEVCDGADNDCDGTSDEGFPARFADTDGDGFGDPNNPSTCNDPTSTTDNTDCDDADPTVYPTAPEICDGLDNDCNGTIDDNLAEDTDNDGFSPCQGDCEDQDATVFPGAPELCDGLDNDCNGFLEATLYADLDGDGFGGTAVPCGSAGVSNAQDCDDTDPAISLPTGWFVDADGDGYGTSGTALGSCTQPPGYVGNSYDCDDTNASIFPGQGCTECSPADMALLASNPFATTPSQSCLMDCSNASDPQQCLADCIADNGLSADCADCFAAYLYCLAATCPACQLDPESPACQQCMQNSDCSAGFTACSGLLDADNDGVFAPADCDDNDPLVNPNALEVCDGADNDCDGQVDEGVASLWYYDMDGDGFGIPETTMVACTQPAGFAPFGGDCNDQNSTVHPGSPELCDGIDNDCDGANDEDAVDSDGDGSSDCVDGCPSDALKTDPGLCGCGLVDVDANSNGVCDSEETFPFVKLGIVGTPNNELEVRLLPNNTYTGMLTATVITVRWPTTAGISITGSDAEYVSPTIVNAVGGLLYEGTTTNGGFSYATFSTLAPFVTLGAADGFTAGVEKPFFRVPYVNTTSTCVQFQVLDNAFQDNENLQWFISLSGYERNNGYITGKTTAIAHPPLTCNNVQRSLSSSGTASLLSSDLHGGVSLSCGSVLASASQTSFSCADVGVVPVTLTLAFPDGSTNVCTAQVTVVDDLAPVIASGSIAACYSDLGALEFDALAATLATDNCTGGITYSTSITSPCATSITVTATDAHGNSSSVSYSTRVDAAAPVVSNAPGSLDATMQCPDVLALAAALALEPSATDDCAEPPSVLLSSDETVGSGCAYVRTRTWTFTDPCGNASTFTQTITVIPVVNVSMRVLLEGPYVQNSERMNDDLRFDGLLPLSQPYSIAPFNYTGNETASASLFAVSDADNAIVDWVLLELRDQTDPTLIVGRRAVLVQRDGDVVDVDGSSSVAFPGMAAGSYHVVVRHRNHMGAMTALPLALSAAPTSVDFTTTTLLTYGSEACKTIGTRRALWAGNALHDKRLRYTGASNDRDVILVRIGGTVPTNVIFNVYALEDVNLDSDVKYTGAFNDRDYILVNIGGTVPTAQRFEQLP